MRTFWRFWRPRAGLIPFVPGGLLDIGTIWSLYRTVRAHRDIDARGRRWHHAFAAAVRIDFAAWRYSRALQKEQAA